MALNMDHSLTMLIHNLYFDRNEGESLVAKREGELFFKEVEAERREIEELNIFIYRK